MQFQLLGLFWPDDQPNNCITMYFNNPNYGSPPMQFETFLLFAERCLGHPNYHSKLGGRAYQTLTKYFTHVL